MMANVSVGIVRCHKGGQARLCTGPHTIFLSAMLDEAFRDMGDGVYNRVYIQSRQNARPIQRRTLQSDDQDYSDTDERATIRR